MAQRLTLKHVKLARIARDARDSGDLETFERARSQLVGCCDGSVGDATARVTPGVVPVLLGGLEAEVRTFRWPQSVLDAANERDDPEMWRRQLQRARETSQADTLRLIGRSRAAIAAGNGEEGVRLYQAALERWAAFGRQSGRIRNEAHTELRPWYERWSDTVDEGARTVQNASPFNFDSPLTVPLLALFGAWWFFGR